MGVSKRCRAGLLTARQTNRQCLHWKLQWQVPAGMSECTLVHDPWRCPFKDRKLAWGLQQRPSPQCYRKQATDIANEWSKGHITALDQQPGKISSRVVQTWGARQTLLEKQKILAQLKGARQRPAVFSASMTDVFSCSRRDCSVRALVSFAVSAERFRRSSGTSPRVAVRTVTKCSEKSDNNQIEYPTGNNLTNEQRNFFFASTQVR